MCAPRVTRHTSIPYSSSSAVNGRSLNFCLHRHPVSVNCLHHARMVLSVGGYFAYFARNARCAVTTDLLVWYSNTQNDFSPRAAIFSLHKLASPSGINVNYDENNILEKKLSCPFCLYRFRKYVSYGFPIINFCNPHYETPGIGMYAHDLWPRGLRCGSAAARLLVLRVWILQVTWMSVSCGCCVMSGMSPCRAHHSFWGVLPSVMWVWSGSCDNLEALAH